MLVFFFASKKLPYPCGSRILGFSIIFMRVRPRCLIEQFEHLHLKLGIWSCSSSQSANFCRDPSLPLLLLNFCQITYLFYKRHDSRGRTSVEFFYIQLTPLTDTMPYWEWILAGLRTSATTMPTQCWEHARPTTWWQQNSSSDWIFVKKWRHNSLYLEGRAAIGLRVGSWIMRWKDVLIPSLLLTFRFLARQSFWAQNLQLVTLLFPLVSQSLLGLDQVASVLLLDALKTSILILHIRLLISPLNCWIRRHHKVSEGT